MNEKKIVLLFVIFGFLIFSTISYAAEFWIVKFSIDSQNEYTSVGQRVSLPLYITNEGLLEDSYNISTVALGIQSENIIIEQPEINSTIIDTNKTEKITIILRSLAQGDVRVLITAYSDACKIAGAVSPLCENSKEIVLKSDYVSLPDIDIISILQIFVIVLILITYRKINLKKILNSY